MDSNEVQPEIQQAVNKTSEDVPAKIEPVLQDEAFVATTNGGTNGNEQVKDEHSNDVNKVEEGVSKAEESKEEQMEEMKGEQMDSQLPEKSYEDNEAYKMFMSKNLHKPVADSLMKMFEEIGTTTAEFDDRAVEMLATFPSEQGKYIIKELHNSHLFGVQNTPQYLMSVMRNFRDRLRSMGAQSAMELPLIPGPDPIKMKALIERTQYQLEVTVGQRKYHSPPGYEGPDPNQSGEGGCVYIGQIPKEIYEDTLVPLFEQAGQLYDLRIMMDPVLGKSRGYGFLIFCKKADAIEAAKKFDGHEILPGKPLKVNVSVANTRLFLGNIPKSKSKDEILEELKKHADNIDDVIIYTNPDSQDGRKNRGFCFIDFNDHKTASDVKRRITMGKIRPWNTDLVVDWAEQQDEPDDEIMQQVKVLYVRNLKEIVTEEQLTSLFATHGKIDKVKRIKDYAFIHFEERESATKALAALNKSELEGVEIEVSLAKPQNDPSVKGKGKSVRRFPLPTYGAEYATPGLGPRNRRDRVGRSGRDQRGGGGYQQVYPGGGYLPPVGGYGASYDPYYPGYSTAYGAGYDIYGAGAYPHVDPYYGQPLAAYGAPGPSMRGAAGASSYGYGGGTVTRGRGGKPSGPPGAARSGSGKRGNRGGSKRAGVDYAGPASKRGGRTEDFSADVPMNLF
uniref:RRM domain-containing protein n=1 Tax=Meloidogyne incognita TaxID=6306 RepID=A0A914KWH2_MELIC